MRSRAPPKNGLKSRPAAVGASRAATGGDDEREPDQRPDEQDRQLPDAREDGRRDERDERAGQRATERQDQVELGQARRVGSVLGEPAVQRGRDDPERDELHDEDREHGPAAGRAVGHPEQRDHRRGGDRPPGRSSRWPRGEKAMMNETR